MIVVTDHKGEIEALNNESRNIDCKWPLLCDRFVAFVDVAGFKALCNNHTEAINLLRTLKTIANKCNPHFKDVVDFILMSDSILFFSKDDSPESFVCFCQVIGDFFNWALTSRLMNAGLAWGAMYVDKEEMIFCGEPLNRAYILQEQMNYYGIICDTSITKYFDSHKDDELKENPENLSYYRSFFVPVICKMKNIKQLEYITENRQMLNFKWFARQYDVTKPFEDSAGICVGDYNERMSSVLDYYKAQCRDMPKIISKIENTEDVISQF